MRAVVGLAALGAAACSLGPRYTQPDLSVPAAFKEAGDWKPAEPSDEIPRGPWWQVFGDPGLNVLEERLSISNQTLKAAEAQFAQARALVGAARAASFPQVGGGLSVTNANQSENRPNPMRDPRYSDYLLRLDVSYEVDLWGRVRKAVDASRASAQASAGDLESTNLSLHAELAVDYFQLRALDAEKEVLDATVAAYERALELTTNRYKRGLVSGADVAQAETQLQTTRVQAIDVQVRRTQFEHAIAVLVGQPASVFSLPASPLAIPAPPVPPGLPSRLLERRPDVAATERRVAAANAQVGITRSAYYPLLTLGGTSGFESSALGNWLRGASNLWAAGPTLALAVFDGGRRRAASEQARAAYDRSVAVYRDTTLNAFTEVEDHLAALRILGEKARVQEAAVAAAQRSLTLATNRYKGGVSIYLEVIAAQSALLTNQRTAVNILVRRLTATVHLIKALGGGWTVRELPRL
jgi:NodT family efflux transporter outer membrane factor (OMF) lipoprotein